MEKETLVSDSDYVFLWSNYQWMMTIESNLRSFKEANSFEWHDLRRVLQVSRNNTIYCYHSKKDIQGDYMRGKQFFDQEYLQRFIEGGNVEHERCQELFHNIWNTETSTLTEDEIIQWIRRLIDCWISTIGFFRGSQTDSAYSLVEALQKEFSSNEIVDLIHPIQHDIAESEALEWKKIAQSRPSREQLLDYVTRYPWLVAAHHTFEEVIETMMNRYETDQISKGDIAVSIRDKKDEIGTRQETLLRGSSGDYRYIVMALQDITLSRMKMKSCWAGTDFYMLKFLEEIARRSGEGIRDIENYYLSHEIEALLTEGVRVSDVEKRRRRECFVGLWKDGKLKYYSGDEAEKVAWQELGDLYDPVRKEDFSGVVANKGKHRGIARILHSNDIEGMRDMRARFAKGEVLFTEMTQPNIMDIASRAGAIVTDEGGMLSHAAIISREFGIPCIVGTHFGTSYVRDGDMVEVDAERGVVKVINS